MGVCSSVTDTVVPVERPTKSLAKNDKLLQFLLTIFPALPSFAFILSRFTFGMTLAYFNGPKNE
jgi:hypothetical protein